MVQNTEWHSLRKFQNNSKELEIVFSPLLFAINIIQQTTDQQTNKTRREQLNIVDTLLALLCNAQKP